MPGSFSKLCSGNVKPCRFVALQSDGTVQACGSNADMWGISQPSTHRLSLSGWDDGYAGTSTSGPINIYGPGDDACQLAISGTVTAGNRLKSDAVDGGGIAVTSDNDKSGAIAINSGVSGDVIWVKPMRFNVAGSSG